MFRKTHINNVLKQKFFTGKLNYNYKIKSLLFAALFIMILSSARAGADSVLSHQKGSVIAIVNDFHITAEEFEIYLEESRTEVISIFIRQHNLKDIPPHFWEKEFDGIKPLDILKETAIREAIKTKIRLVYMYENEVIDSPDYSSFLSIYHDFMAERSNYGKENILYGPVLFSERAFFDYWYSNCLIELKDKLFYKNVPAIPLASGKEMASQDFFDSKPERRKRTNNIDREIEDLFRKKIRLYQSNAEVIINYERLKDINPSL